MAFGAGQGISRPEGLKLVIDVVSEPVDVRLEREFLGKGKDEGPARGAKEGAVRVGKERSGQVVAARTD